LIFTDEKLETVPLSSLLPYSLPLYSRYPAIRGRREEVNGEEVTRE